MQVNSGVIFDIYALYLILAVIEKSSLAATRRKIRLRTLSVIVTLSRLLLQIRLSKLNNLVGPHRRPLPTEDSLLLTVRLLSNQESFHGTGDSFGVSKGHAHRTFIKIVQSISTIQADYIMWREGVNDMENLGKFNQSRGPGSFPNVFGCVDGSHIAILGSKGDDSYCNRKGPHSIIRHRIRNFEGEFINVNAGWPGSCHDASVWMNSCVYHKLKNEPNMVPANSCLLGDSAYPLDKFIMVCWHTFAGAFGLTYGQV